MKVKNQYSICRFCKAKIYTPYKLYICPVCRKKQDTGEYVPFLKKKNMEVSMRNPTLKKHITNLKQLLSYTYRISSSPDAVDFYKARAFQEIKNLTAMGMSRKDIKALHPLVGDLIKGLGYLNPKQKTLNPSVCYLCNRNFTAKRRRPVRAMKGKNPVLVCGECARGMMRANPLAGLLATVGNAAITGVGLGIGFGAVSYAQKKLSKKNPRRKKK